ncbi:unnamed protein product [Phyllotreta striolata]|uniref:Uncharacterized protein n=1 Tax=Phyllotreta striolata TaxID=444603 RepID=A0A9N9TRQ0_PHYSR|nr:unnamed protein product [Phyllotreta striolata]
MGSILTTYANSNARLNGKTAVITGGNGGIGKVTAKDFFERGARVIIACRNLSKGQEAVDDIKSQCKDKKNLGELQIVELDLSSLKSVRKCAKELLDTEGQINLLINNAGIMMLPELTKSEDGYEMQFATNHLGHFLLTMLLMPKIMQSTPARIVNVSSLMHHFACSLDMDDLNFEKSKYGPTAAYNRSKLSNVLFSKELARQLEEHNVQGINVYSLHPGAINSNLQQHVSGVFMDFSKKFFFKSVEQGAQTTIYCATHENCADETGRYYAECKPTWSSKTSNDLELAKNLWKTSLKMCGLQEDYNPFESHL